MTVTTSTPEPPTKTSRPEPQVFQPGSLLWEYVGLHKFTLAANSAFLLQVMHPAIGTVVGRWSTFRTDPWGRAARSFASVQTWIYGGQTAIEEGERLRQMHKPLRAVDDQGRDHHALSAGPWAWVPLTAYYATVTGARYFSPAPLTPAQEEQAYQEVLQLCRILQVPERMLPATTADYWAYFDDMIEHTLENHPVAQELLTIMDHGVLPPPVLPAALNPLWRPLGLAGGRLNRFLTVGTLPPAARDKLGLTWTRADERRLRRLGTLITHTEARLPERVRYMPIAHRARQAARAQERLQTALAHRPM